MEQEMRLLFYFQTSTEDSVMTNLTFSYHIEDARNILNALYAIRDASDENSDDQDRRIKFLAGEINLCGTFYDYVDIGNLRTSDILHIAEIKQRDDVIRAMRE